MYGVGGIPHAQFGGYIQSVGGGGDMYPTYLQKYNQIINNDSPAEIALSLEMGSSNTLLLIADVTLTGDISTTNNKIVFLLTRYISDAYFSSVTGYEQQTFELDTTGQTGTYSQEIPFDSTWSLSDINAIAMIQTFAGDHEILQAEMTGFSGTVALFSSSIQSGPASLVVNLTDNSLPEGGIESWEWDFDNDGTTDSTEQNPTYEYTVPGTYSVKLKIFDGVEYEEAIYSDYITVVEPGTPFSGQISGNWSASNNPYVIDGDSSIELGSELNIAAGTHIIIDNATISFFGNITANGSEADMIVFNSDAEWNGLRIMGDNVEAYFSYCQFSNATNSAISIENGPIVTVENCAFSNNNSSANPAGIQVLNSDAVIIKKNIFTENTSSNNAGSIGCIGSDPAIRNNLIVNNNANFGAMSIKNESYPTVSNNTIANNTSDAAIMMFFNANPLFINNIIRFDSGAIISINSFANFGYNNVSGGIEGEGNIDADPLFISDLNYQLAAGSPCIDSGNPDSQYNDADGSRNDLGAWGGPDPMMELPVSSDENSTPELSELNLAIYPNPFNPTTTISFSLDNTNSDSVVNIYNMKGQQVKSLNISAGNSSVIWNGNFENGKAAPSGVYLIKLISGNDSATKKAMLLK